ncbi:hypothetical protein [Psychrobacter piscatorii]|uniref:hypothetical protein n=1 Tax=Psychrobacter piscatorii TaxID=554343 RepID=UPI0037358EF8
MKKSTSLILLIITCQFSYASWYTNYDSTGRIVSLSSEKVLIYDASLLKDQYVFVNKNPKAINNKNSYSKEEVMKVEDTYIFNESASKGLKASNKDFRFDRIITVEDQMKDDRRIVRSVLNDSSVSRNVKEADTDETKPILVYKPYAVIMRYSILNKSDQIVESWSEKSSMQYLTIEDCNKEIPKYRKIAQNELDDSFFVKSQLLKGKTSVSCAKVNK